MGKLHPTRGEATSSAWLPPMGCGWGGTLRQQADSTQEFSPSIDGESAWFDKGVVKGKELAALFSKGSKEAQRNALAGIRRLRDQGRAADARQAAADFKAWAVESVKKGGAAAHKFAKKGEKAWLE